jgi:hypothetical protein
MTKPRTHLPPPGIDAKAFARVAGMWLISTGQQALSEAEREAIIFWLKRHSRDEILEAIEAAPSPLTIEGVNQVLAAREPHVTDPEMGL